MDTQNSKGTWTNKVICLLLGVILAAGGFLAREVWANAILSSTTQSRVTTLEESVKSINGKLDRILERMPPSKKENP